MGTSTLVILAGLVVGGFTCVVAGPGITMLQVRAATQVARNEVELDASLRRIKQLFGDRSPLRGPLVCGS